jgi:hypothetical protein
VRIRGAMGWGCALVVLVALAAGGCGGSKGHSGPSAEEFQFLFEHNAQFNDGRTVRWGGLPITVALNDIARADEVTAWSQATGGAVTFSFVGGAGNISFRFGGGSGICGTTLVTYTDSGQIVSADVRVVASVFRGPQCVRTVTHEVGHAIGMLDHSADGGLMDPDGGDGSFTPPVTEMIRNLYALAPGTFIGSAQSARAALRPRGLTRTRTFVHPLRP